MHRGNVTVLEQRSGSRGLTRVGSLHGDCSGEQKTNGDCSSEQDGHTRSLTSKDGCYVIDDGRF